MIQQEIVTKVYESLVFLIPEIDIKHRRILEEHIQQVHVAGYELGLQHSTRQKAILQLKDGVIINRFPNINIAATILKCTEMSIRNHLKKRHKDILGFEWKYDKNIR